MLIPVAARSNAWVCGRLLTGNTGSNLAGAWMSVSCSYCVLSGRGICIQRDPTNFGVSECDRETSIIRRPWSCCAIKIHIYRPAIYSTNMALA